MFSSLWSVGCEIAVAFVDSSSRVSSAVVMLGCVVAGADLSSRDSSAALIKSFYARSGSLECSKLYKEPLNIPQ